MAETSEKVEITIIPEITMRKSIMKIQMINPVLKMRIQTAMLTRIKQTLMSTVLNRLIPT